MSSELSRILAELQISGTERDNRKAMLQRLVTEDVVLIERLTIERFAVETGSPMSALRIRAAVVRIVEAYQLHSSTLPRGIKLFGNGDKTAYYFGRHSASNRLTDSDLLLECQTGWLVELAEMCATALHNYKLRNGLIAEEETE